jgi:Electron transfer DM13
MGASNRRLRLRGRVVVPLVLVGAALLTVVAYLFAPWKLVVDEVVDEPPPSSGSAGRQPAGPGSAERSKPGRPEVVATGRFVSHEHATSGRVRVLELDDGTRVLRIERLVTSNGPDLRVWLSDARVVGGRAGWFVFDDGRHVDLGALRGNLGSQNYPVPAHVDLDELYSVSIWCRRFHVSFGAAELSLHA